MKVSKNFWLQEFLPPDLYEMSPQSGIWMIDRRIINIAQFIRERYGKPVTINNWHSGGQYKESGFRNPFTKTGALLSQHKFGRAIDAKIDGLHPEEIREDIRQNYALFRVVGLTTIEVDTPTWVHMDCRNTNQDSL